MTSFSEFATRRFDLEWAPDGLALAQELLNTGVPGAADLDPLRAVDTAQAWLSAILTEWADRTQQAKPAVELTERDLPRLRRTRNSLRDWIAEGAPQSFDSSVDIGLGDSRDVSYSPRGKASATFDSIVGIELLLAWRMDRLRRFKICANPACGASFYDGSPNNSRRWHDVKTCGNIANLRASRARRAMRADSPVAPTRD